MEASTARRSGSGGEPCRRPPQFECVEVSPVPGTRPSFPVTQLSGGRVDGPDVGAGRPSRPFPVPLRRRCPTGNAMGTASTPSRAPRARHQSGGSGPSFPGRPAGQIASARRSRRWHRVSDPREPGSSGVSLRFGIIHFIAERLTTASRPLVESTDRLIWPARKYMTREGVRQQGRCWSMIKNARPDRHRVCRIGHVSDSLRRLGASPIFIQLPLADVIRAMSVTTCDATGRE